MARPLFQDSPCIAVFPSGSFDGTLLWVTRSDIRDARELIYKGRVSNIGYLILGRNRSETLIDDGNLDVDKSSYLTSLRDGFFPIRWGTTFYVKPYGPHQLSR